MALKILNPATCPRCGSKDTKRGGYSEQHKGALWKCSACSGIFVVPVLAFAKKEESPDLPA